MKQDGGILTCWTNVRAPARSLPVVAVHLFTGTDSKCQALAIRELLVALALFDLSGIHVPLFQGSKNQIFSQKNVERSINAEKRTVPDEDNPVETIKHITDLVCRQPPVVATYPISRLDYSVEKARKKGHALICDGPRRLSSYWKAYLEGHMKCQSPDVLHCSLHRGVQPDSDNKHSSVPRHQWEEYREK